MKNKLRTLIIAVLSLLLCFAFSAGCADGSGTVTPPPSGSTDDGEGNGENKITGDVEYPAVSPWTVEPKVKDTYFCDFGKDRRIGDEWYLVNYGWGQNGVSKSNAGYTQSTGALKKLGATGGAVILKSYGHYCAEESKRGQGACLISSRMFGPGRYEVRMKVVPRFGPCSTTWSYYTNSSYGANTADKIQYHEIDIECPQIGNGFNGWGGVAYEEYYQDSENGGKTVNNSQGVGAPCDSPYNDGKWHVFAFDWRTDGYNYDASKGENQGAVIWYMDGKEVARTAKHTPYYPDQLWIGNWFPDNAEDWLGVADFDEAYMYVDWVRITEYDDPYRTVGRDGKQINPELGGCVSFSTSGGNTNYGTQVPINNYVSNGKFADATGWVLNNATASGKLVMGSGGSAEQTVSAQYGGYEFELSASAAVTRGKVKIYAEYIKGEYPERSNSNKKMTAVTVGKSEEIEFVPSVNEQTLTFELPQNSGVNNVRIVIKADDGTEAEVSQVKMYLKTDAQMNR